MLVLANLSCIIHFFDCYRFNYTFISCSFFFFAYHREYHFSQARRDATQVVANLQRQQVQSRMIASAYLEANLNLIDILISG